MTRCRTPPTPHPPRSSRWWRSRSARSLSPPPSPPGSPAARRPTRRASNLPTTRRSSPTSSTSSSSCSPPPGTRTTTVAGRRQIRRIRDLVQTDPRVSGGAVVGIDAHGNVREFLGGLLGIEEQCRSNCPNGVIDRRPRHRGAAATATTQKGRDGDTVFQAAPLTKVARVTPVRRARRARQHAPVRRQQRRGARRRLARARGRGDRRGVPRAAHDATARGDGDDRGRDRRRRPHRARRHRALSPTTSSRASPTRSTRMAERLDSSRGHERAFLLSVSHDLRTPLTSIRGYAEAMLDGTIDDERRAVRGRPR